VLTKVVKIVESNWSTITIVAKEVLKRQTITGAEVKITLKARRQ